MNKVILKGRIVHTPEVKKTPNDVSVCSFSVAVDRRFKSASGEKATDFFDVVAWRQTADFIGKYFEKGQEILVSGELQTRSYEDKNGNKRKVCEVIAEQVEFCGGKLKTTPEQKPSISADDFEEITDDEDLPF